MKKLSSTLPMMVLSLGVITIVASCLLGGVYVITKDVIAQAEEKTKVAAISEVAPKFDNNPVQDQFVYHAHAGTKDSVTVVVYPAKLGGKLVGAAVESASPNGFGGMISIMYGFEEDGTIKNFKVLKHTETAGLGAKMEDWFSTKKNNQCVIGMNPANSDMRVKKDGGDVDAITAATITSRAFLGALNDAFAAYKQLKDNGNTVKEAQENKK